MPKNYISILVFILFLISLYFISIIYQKQASKIYKKENLNKNNMTIEELNKKVKNNELQKMVFAGGCFWCTQASFNPEFGVVEAFSGYFGGKFPNPTYEDISSGETDHREVVLVYFNPASTTAKKMLVNFWHDVNPTQADGQFADIGKQYQTAIYYFNEEQKKLAEESKKILQDSKKFDEAKIVTEILDGQNLEFYPAEEYHQDYSEKNPVRYEYYKNGSGRSKFIKDNWLGDKTFEEFLQGSSPTKERLGEVVENSREGRWKNFTKEMKEKRLKELTSLQANVTQDESTETPFKNEYDKNYEKGIYVDIVSGEPLYSSSDKFDSGTGWPSFVKPISLDFLTLKTDNYLFYSRTEVRSRIADSHLGHVFDDGPVDRGGKRYCMNSAAMEFIPLDKMEKVGYGEFVKFIK
jgi:peptide methionine sulfoxide reductase msrA/msrB